MNEQLNKAVVNPWLASTISFGIITAFFLCLFAIFPTPLPSLDGLTAMPWWAPLGGLMGAVQVYAGLTLVTKVGAGPFVGLTVTAALITSLVVDHFGLFHMEVHAINIWRRLVDYLMGGNCSDREILNSRLPLVK